MYCTYSPEELEKKMKEKGITPGRKAEIVEIEAERKPSQVTRYYEKKIGVVWPHGYKNGCCEDKPFILYATAPASPKDDDNSVWSYSCRCECDGWCTAAHSNPVDAIMEYEVMCREYPEEIRFNDPDLYWAYQEYY